MNSFFFFLVDRRDDKAVINSHTQSGGTGVRIPVMTSGLIISTFLSVELRLMGPIELFFNRKKYYYIFLRGNYIICYLYNFYNKF